MALTADARFYIGLFGMRLRTSLATGMQYRWNFLLELAMSTLWAASSLLPLWVVAGSVRSVKGWSYPEMMVVTGWFIVLKSIIDSGINPSLLQVVERIRDGTLDFVLLKPADGQFLVSTEKFDVMRLSDTVAGVAMLTFAFHLLGRAPAPLHVLTALALLGAAVLVVYSVWLLVACVAFWAVRLDNLAYLFMSVFDFARWPVAVFQGWMRVLFTIIIPLGIMTTYPAEALLNRPESHLASALVGSVAFALLARFIWSRAIGRYTSASS